MGSGESKPLSFPWGTRTLDLPVPHTVQVCGSAVTSLLGTRALPWGSSAWRKEEGTLWTSPSTQGALRGRGASPAQGPSHDVLGRWRMPCWTSTTWCMTRR